MPTATASSLPVKGTLNSFKRVDDQYEEDKRSQDGNGKEVAHQERAPDDHVIEKRKPAKYDYAEKA